MKFLKYIICSLTLATVISFGACTDEIKPGADSEVYEPADDDGMVDLNISFALEDDGGFATRDDDDKFVAFDINNIDLLVYSLRDANDQVLYQYGQGIVDEELKEAKALQNYIETTDNNQTLMKPNWEGNKVDIKLRVMRGTVYKLSVWAQSSDCEAYDFNYLTCVKVDYEKMTMNDEKCDAFCATSIFSIGQVNANVSVTLTRPFAQVKVGMLWDEKETDGSLTNQGYTHSALELNGVAKFFNVVENRTWTSDEVKRFLDDKTSSKFNEHLFDFIVKDESGDATYPEDTSLKYDETGKPIVTTTADFDYQLLPSGDNASFTVHNYKEWTADNLTSVTFKNLAMCYVLVPETTFETDGNENYVENGGDVKDGDIRWVTCIVGNTVKVQYSSKEKTWTVVMVLDENLIDITEKEKSKYQPWSWDKVTYYWLRDKDGNYVKLDDNGEFKKAITAEGEEIKPDDNGEGGYKYDPDYMDDMSVVYPGSPTEVKLGLLSLSFSKDEKGTDAITYSPDGLEIKVKRNWRSNLLFNSWYQITNDAGQ